MRRLLKTLWKKEKMLVTTMFSTLPKSNFNFSLTPILLSANVFNLDWFKILSFGKELTPSHTMPVGNKPFENTVGKGEIAHNEQFLLLQQCFLPVWITFCHFLQI